MTSTEKEKLEKLAAERARGNPTTKEEPTPPFARGDVVRLKCGGPKMVVNKVLTEVTCEVMWTSAWDSKLIMSIVYQDVIEHVKE